MKAKLVFGVSFLVLLIIGGVVLFQNNVFYDPPDGAGNNADTGKEITGTIKLHGNDDYAKLAKVSITRAYQNFNAKFKRGRVLSITLGEDNGYLIYDMFFIDNKAEKEAKIDAGTGRILGIDSSESDSGAAEETKADDKKKEDMRFTGTIRVKDSQKKQFPSLARINPAQAVKSVEKQFPGKVTKVALENENNFLMYSVVINNQGKLLEVKVDAGTGKVVGKEDASADKGNN